MLEIRKWHSSVMDITNYLLCINKKKIVVTRIAQHVRMCYCGL